jgi:GPI-anchor transamidase subunit U
MQQGFVVCCFFIFSSVLGPVVWQLWIYMRSGNANFYFGVTLAFATAQVIIKNPKCLCIFKEVLMTKNGPIDFAQSWSVYLKKSN